MDNIISKQIDLPPTLTKENKFGIEEAMYESFTEDGRIVFNFLYEYMERNPDSVPATDVFPLTGFTNEQVIYIQKILNAAKYNSSVLAAQFISLHFPYGEIREK